MFGRMFLHSSFPRRRESSLLLALTFGLAACSTAFAEAIPETTAAAIPADQQAFLDSCKDWDEWEKPAPPFRIHGSTFYVGTCGISAIFLANPEGHFLIDTGTEVGARHVLANIQQIGFDLEGLALLTHSHEHFDHVGGFAYFQEVTGVRVYASKLAAEAIRTGVSFAEDPQHGMHESMRPVTIHRTVSDGEIIANEMGTMRAIETPGHTPGALSWQWEACERGGDCLSIVYADSLSPVSRDDYLFSDHPEYVAEYRAGLQRLREVKCDILLTPHPSASKMLERAANGTLVGGMTCTEYADAVEKRLDTRLAKEARE